MNKKNTEIEIIGESEHIKNLYRQIDIAAKDNRTVLIEGPTGTGKELIVKNIHDKSSRKKGDLIEVNCSAIPNDLFESELFGHEKGAFTGATAKKIGLVEQADQGTLFLDEIVELKQEHQPKLLRFLEDGSYKTVGGNKTLTSNARIIAATNKDLLEKVNTDDFREDLYYRLNQFKITTEPLANRPEDVICLVNHIKSKVDPRIKFLLYCTPEFEGNVRQLESLISNPQIDDVVGELEKCLNSIDKNQKKAPELPWKIGQGQLKNLNSEGIAEIGRKTKKHNEQAHHWRRLNYKTKSLREALSHVAINDPDINFRKCVEAYEIITLYQNTKLSKTKIAKVLHIRYARLHPDEFKKQFGFDFPDRDDRYNVISPIDAYPSPEKFEP